MRVRNRRPNFDILVIWRALIVGGWGLVAWSRMSYLGPAEIASCFLCDPRDGKILLRSSRAVKNR